MKYRYLSFFPVVLVIFAACSKGGDEGSGGGGGPHVVTPSDTTKPGITINTPTDNQVFSSGSTVTVAGKVTDDLGLYQGTIRIVNDANGMALVNQSYVIHGLLEYNFNIAQAISASSATDYTVTVSFEDHGSNHFSRSVKVKVVP